MAKTKIGMKILRVPSGMSPADVKQALTDSLDSGFSLPDGLNVEIHLTEPSGKDKRWEWKQALTDSAKSYRSGGFTALVRGRVERWNPPDAAIEAPIRESKETRREREERQWSEIERLLGEDFESYAEARRALRESTPVSRSAKRAIAERSKRATKARKQAARKKTAKRKARKVRR